MADEPSPWEYKPDGQTVAEKPQLGSRGNDGSRPKARRASTDEVIEWTASEYIEHQRGANWYLALFFFTIILAVGVWFLTRDKFAVIFISLIGLVVAVFTVHKPKEIAYQLGSDGLRIGTKFYPYSHFKSFAIIREGGLNSVNLDPIRKFMPPITAYYEAGDEEKIVDILGQHLAYEERGPDSIDRLTRRLRF